MMLKTLIYTGVVLISICTQTVVASTELITAIEQRYYMIMRLEKPVATLVAAYQKKRSLHLPKNSADLFRDPLVKRTFATMENTQSTMPFYKLWSCFLAYRFVEDKQFIKEILTAILLLYKDLILSLRTESDSAVRMIDAQLRSCAQHDQSTDLMPLLETSQVACRQYRNLCPTVDCHELNAALTSQHIIQPFPYALSSHSLEENIGTVHHLLGQEEMETIATDNTMRLYYIQRLLKAMFILSGQKGRINFTFDATIIDRLASPVIRACISALVKQQTVAPLFDLWSQLTAYDFINDTHTVREYVLILCLAYRHIVDMYALEKKAVDPKDLLLVYETIANLPVAELLDLLDDVVEQYDTLAQEYALKDSSLSWKEWFASYWWSAPVVVGSFFTTFLKHARILLFPSR
ncbi:MAG: hypothetical protein IT346_01125 [Epsilonproteobacteria bacterium]|nr:hypothetical protein [Campylobacterota bacterium]